MEQTKKLTCDAKLMYDLDNDRNDWHRQETLNNRTYECLVNYLLITVMIESLGMSYELRSPMGTERNEWMP